MEHSKGVKIWVEVSPQTVYCQLRKLERLNAGITQKSRRHLLAIGPSAIALPVTFRTANETKLKRRPTLPRDAQPHVHEAWRGIRNHRYAQILQRSLKLY